MPFSQQRAHLKWASWLHDPLFCPGDAMTLQKQNKVDINENKVKVCSCLQKIFT